MTTPARVVLVTIPKAGTYLFSEAVRRLGFEQTHLHLAPKRVVAYDPARLEEGRAHPERFQVDCSIEQSVRLVRAGQFAASHLPFDETTADALEGCRVVFAMRELRAALVSRMRFRFTTGRTEAPEGFGEDDEQTREQVATHLSANAGVQLDAVRAQLGWLRHPGVLAVRFEDLLARDMGVIGSLRSHLGPGRAPAEPDAEVAGNALATETLTRSSGTTDLGAMWSDAAEAVFERLGGPALNVAFGYEPSVEFRRSA
ncbi:MAG: hypothetical protein DHS20C14_05980 [Phycisphaeraceae bacterium]|nr:MAG: hypothetical protein DHS20C14_05980 [Phycisphaeraceae bacterium]